MRSLLELQAMGNATSGAAPVENTSFLPLLSSQGQACAEIYAADNSEASDEIAERTTALKSAMHEAGFGEPEIDLSVHIEYYMRELGEAWSQEGRLTGSTEPLATWAMRQLLSQPFADDIEFAALEAQVRALRGSLMMSQQLS